MTTAMLTTDSAAAGVDRAGAASQRDRARRIAGWVSTRVPALLLLAGLLGVWEGAVRLFHVPRHLVPPVSDVFVALWRGLVASPLAKDGFWYHGGVTLAEILLGFGIGSAVGLALGIVVSQMPRLEALLEPYV